MYMFSISCVWYMVFLFRKVYIICTISVMYMVFVYVFVWYLFMCILTGPFSLITDMVLFKVVFFTKGFFVKDPNLRYEGGDVYAYKGQD
jgi:hypothetical protein